MLWIYIYTQKSQPTHDADRVSVLSTDARHPKNSLGLQAEPQEQMVDQEITIRHIKLRFAQQWLSRLQFRF